MKRDAETAFLTARATAHAAARGVDIATHRAHCDCSRRPHYCTACDRDVERCGMTIYRGEGHFLCEDCADRWTDIYGDQPVQAAE